MPGGDRTGPIGAGPMTGRAAGYCAGYTVPGSVHRAFGGGRFRHGGRGGHGWRHMFHATGLPGWARTDVAGTGPAAAAPPSPELTPDRELEVLRQQVDQATHTLEQIRERISELESTAKA